MHTKILKTNSTPMQCQVLHTVFLFVLGVEQMRANAHIQQGVDLFVYLGFYDAFNTVQVISRWVVRRAEETST